MKPKFKVGEIIIDNKAIVQKQKYEITHVGLCKYTYKVIEENGKWSQHQMDFGTFENHNNTRKLTKLEEVLK
jgi:hypothetical protein